jgi:hypothetical protein
MKQITIDMAKRFLTLAFITGSLTLAACSTEPSDLRPETKVSVDIVPPGTRKTPNLDNAADKSEHDRQQQVQLNHDEHANEIGGKPKSVTRKVETTHKDSVENHE